MAFVSVGGGGRWMYIISSKRRLKNRRGVDAFFGL